MRPGPPAPGLGCGLSEELMLRRAPIEHTMATLAFRYVVPANQEKLAERGLKSRIHRRAYRNRKLSEAQKAANTTRSKVRARVEHVFGDQKNGMGAELVRTIGIVRARCKIGMTNLVYNMRRLVCLEDGGRGRVNRRAM